MKRIEFVKYGLFIFSFFQGMSLSYAGAPVWTFLPLTPTTVSLSTTDTRTIQYQVTNQSRRTHTLEMQNIAGISQDTTSGNCANPFTLGYQQSCTLRLTVDGATLQGDVVGGPVVCQQGNALQCYQPSTADSLNITLTAAPGTTTLSAIVSTLGLSVNNTTLNAALTGTPRVFTIRNVGAETANNITCPTFSSSSITSIVCSSNCSSLSTGQDCLITITPSSTASATPGNTSPTPITLSVSGSNTNTLTLTVNVLTYGSVYQGGYVYAVDDATPNVASIGGKVAALADQASPSPGINWASTSSGSTSSISIYGISETSTTSSPNPSPGASPQPVSGQRACNGNTDGLCDSNNIYVYYQTTATGAPINTALYATGLCKATINGYTGWYLPAICEMGYRISGSIAGCGTSASPTLQNMQSNLVNNGNIGGLSGNHWSSTESSAASANAAWMQNFTVAGGGQSVSNKGARGARCSRILIP